MSGVIYLISLIVFVLIIIVHYKYYIQVNESYEIVQIFLNRLTVDILKEKHPVIIYDQLIDPNEFIKIFFKYMYISSREDTLSTSEYITNKSKFFIIWNSDQDKVCNVDIISPKYKNISDENFQFITAKLKFNQVLILPTHWTVRNSDEGKQLKYIQLDGPFSQLFQTIQTIQNSIMK